MDIKDIFDKSLEPQNISAFAFNTGRIIEAIVNEATNNINEVNTQLRAKILAFRTMLPLFDDGIAPLSLEQMQELYDTHFNIAKLK